MSFTKLEELLWHNAVSSNDPSLWVFGYGSLLWNPCMQYTQVVRASLKGYARRFSLANETYRGTPKTPGRVVTLVPEPTATTHGLAYRIQGARSIAAAVDHLFAREVQNGYHFHRVPLEPLDGDEPDTLGPIIAVTVIADPKNPLYLGHCESIGDTALQIALAHGAAGPNYEYLFKLSGSMRRYFPFVRDHYLLALESLVLDVMQTVLQP